MVARTIALEKEIARLETLEYPAVVAGGGAIVHLETQTLALAGTFSFTNISASYEHLLFIMSMRSAAAAEDDIVIMEFNGIAQGNVVYDSFITRWAGSPKVAWATNVAQRLVVAYCPGATAPSQNFGPVWCWVYNYADTSYNRGYNGHYAFGKDITAPDIEATEGHATGQWKNTAAAISRVDFDTWAGVNNFAANSMVSMYGVTHA
jgi:hypothetical protein